MWAVDWVDATDELDAVDAVLERWLVALDEYVVAVCVISSSISLEVSFDAVADEPVPAAVVVVLGAWAANHAPKPRKDAALTAPVIRRARRAGCGFLEVVMEGSCARRRKST